MDEAPHGSVAPAASSAPLQLGAVDGDTIVFSPLPIEGSVTIGRGDDCDVRVQNRSVSRRHAVLHIGPPLRLEDLGSANGTFTTDYRATLSPSRTLPMRRLSRSSQEIAVGERFNLGAVTLVVRRAPTAAADEPAKSSRSPGEDDGILVRDAAMRALYEQAGRAAKSGLSVLILGETGVGKEVLARTLHARSPRAAKPYLEINCAALSESLLESELFGHEKSSFTGADQAKVGLLESADGGTVFLDEVGELPLAFQAKLLRVIEDKKVLRVGGRAPRKIDVRFVAATNRDLQADAARGAFREDLYFRLNGISFEVPPLRARPSEIVPLAERFLDVASRQLDHSEAPRLSAEARAVLERYRWPGNVRELRNAMERAAVLCGAAEVAPADLPGPMQGMPRAAQPPGGPVTRPVDDPATLRAAPPVSAAPDQEAPDQEVARLKAEMKAAERQRIVSALERSAGNQTRAAKLLGMSLRTLVNRLDEHGIERPRKRT